MMVVQMSVKTWILGVILGILAGANAGLVFSIFESRFTAALVAGGGFILIGLYLMALAWSDQRPARWITFYTSHIHLFLVSLPMVGVRILNPELAFEDLSILGLKGPVFHKCSTFFYQLTLLGIVVDSVRFYYDKKKAAGESAAVSSS